MDPDVTQEAAELATTPPPPSAGSDQRTIVGQTGQNVLGLGIGAVATFVAQVIMTNRLGDELYGIVTVTTQFAFIAAAATRFGMDVANVRLVAILVGRGEAGRARGLVRRSTAIAAAVSVPSGVAVILAAPWLAGRFAGSDEALTTAFRAAGITIPLAALAFTAMGATRGLKVMRPTLLAQWIGQPLGWIAFTLTIWALIGATAGGAAYAFTASWGLALAVAWYAWVRRSHRLRDDAAGEGIAEEHTGALLRFGALRAPGTLFSQLLFWSDFFVLSLLWSDQGSAGGAATGQYSAVLRAAQSLFLFLTSVSLTFSPFVADLHHRGEREQLDRLYRSVTRWTLTATIPVLLVLAILPGPVLRIFGAEFVAGQDALRIVIIGMIVPVMVGTVGFILIMAGRTGWDLLVYVGGFAIDVVVALLLAGPAQLGVRGAAIAQAVTLSFSAVARLYLVRRFLGIWPFDGAYLRLVVPTLVGGAAMVGLAAAIRDERWAVELVVAGLGGAAVYGAVALAIGITREERASLARLAGRLTGRRAT